MSLIILSTSGEAGVGQDAGTRLLLLSLCCSFFLAQLFPCEFLCSCSPFGVVPPAKTLCPCLGQLLCLSISPALASFLFLSSLCFDVFSVLELSPESHRVPEWVRRDHSSSSGPTLSTGHGIVPGWFWSISREGHSTAPLGNLCQCTVRCSGLSFMSPAVCPFSVCCLLLCLCFCRGSLCSPGSVSMRNGSGLPFAELVGPTVTSTIPSLATSYTSHHCSTITPKALLVMGNTTQWNKKLYGCFPWMRIQKATLL